jgi:acetyl-CoA carboxylase biotin carboxyl carrier protein
MAKKATKKTSKSKAPAKKVAKKASPKTCKPTCTSPVISEVNELVELMTAHDITEVHLEDGDRKILLRRGVVCSSAGVAPVAAPAPVSAPVAPAAAPAPAETPAQASAAADNLVDIVSPMVGTFYSSPSPDSDPFISEGGKVSVDTVVCIVEAMKVMNEIKAECTGTIAEICVTNAQPVEFGQVLFRVKPA